MTTKHALFPLVLSIALALAGCPSPAPMGDVDAFVPPGTDGGPLPGTDAPIAPGTDAPSSSGGWASHELPTYERVTAIYCEGATNCVIGTNGTREDSSLYTATVAAGVTGTLFTLDATFGAPVGIDQPDVLGFTRIGDQLIAELDSGSDGFFSAVGPIGTAGSWSLVSIGAVSGADFGLNAQYGFGFDGTEWTQFRNGLLYTSTDTPGPTATWEITWSPNRTPPVPDDLETLRATDPTLCDSDPAYSSATRPTGLAHVAADRAIIVMPAGGMNQAGTDTAGVCISTDGGHRFHHVEFAEVVADENAYGPSAVACTTADHCVALGGSQLYGNGYAYVTDDATMGSASTWTRATIPSIGDDGLEPHYVFFAPDGMHGWAVGERERLGLVWQTTDGGTTWTDLTAVVRTVSEQRWWSGFAVDPTHILIGGENGHLIGYN